MKTRRKFLLTGAAALGAVAAGAAGWHRIRRATASEPPIAGAVADFTLMETPRPMPRDPFDDQFGAGRTFADYLGRVLLVNFWATWCLPCKVEMPSLDRLEATMGGPDLAVLPISLDREGAGVVVPYYREAGLAHLPIALDPQNAIANALGIQALPTTLIVNRDGMAVGYYLGPTEWDSEDAQTLLRWFIDRDAPPPASDEPMET